ncbi:MAG: DEAD/DEAH box helicase family protein [Candidatus Omnitrophota bacterium]|jgi:type III restriction enzyme
MKLKFKQQVYQTKAVEAVVDCFNGQSYIVGLRYRMDPGKRTQVVLEEAGFKNADILLNGNQLLENVQAVQRRQNLPLSSALVATQAASLNLDVEMETGTGKTYCYTKTIFELHKRFGWGKFVVVVPSIAIREGVYKSFQITAEHFLESYGKKVRFFIYNSKSLHDLESFSSDAGINVMIINVQAFNARGKDARRIYEELDDFQSRKPIDVIRANRPIMIIDEPQKMEGSATLGSLKEFNPLFILRYSATHKTTHNKIHRLDALDAYNQKLVKKIAVRGISVKGLSGTNAYLYLESIIISKQAPVARLELEIKTANGIKRETRIIDKGKNLFDVSGGLEQYRGYVVSDISAITDTVLFTPSGAEIKAGEVIGDISEQALRRIQIREAIRAHIAKEQTLFHQGIKVLSLFFIDEVAKYRVYTKDGEQPGEYAQMFEEEYKQCIDDARTLFNTEYASYINRVSEARTHNGYFSIDKKTKHLIDPETGKKSTETEDVDAYDLILKDKERLLSFEEPVRFIFSHSALREGWDNPNVFVICALKHSDNTVSRRQEVGRGLRIAVDIFGERQDNPATVHQTNVLTVVASESYKDFVAGLQKDISESLSERPRKADTAYFTGKTVQTPKGPLEIDSRMANQIYKYLVKNDYVDDDNGVTVTYHEAVKNGALAPLPEEFQSYASEIFHLIDSVYSDALLPDIDNDRGAKVNPLNANFEKKEFKELWNRINQKAVYSVHFDSAELVEKAAKALDEQLRVTPLRYTIVAGEQKENVGYEEMKAGDGFKVAEQSTKYETSSVHSNVGYDLIGKIAEGAHLTRRTVARILSGLQTQIFNQFKLNPEQFIAEAARLINEQKATVIIEHLAYDALQERHDIDIFTDTQAKQNFANAGEPLKRHIYDYVITQSDKERQFVNELDVSTEVVVYAKLPRGFFIPTPVGDYNPDWAIAFKEGSVKHIYFVAETKGSMSTLELREIEKTKIECARKFFHELNEKIDKDKVQYDVIDSYGKLLNLVNA